MRHQNAPDRKQSVTPAKRLHQVYKKSPPPASPLLVSISQICSAENRMTSRKFKTEVAVAEPDEKLESPEPKPSAEPISPTATIRKNLNLPSDIRSGNIPTVISSDPEAPYGRDDDGKPIRAIHSDLEILARVAPNFKAAVASRCDHLNFLVCPGCGKRFRKSDPPRTVPSVKVAPPAIKASQLSEAWGIKTKQRIVSRPDRKISREVLGLSPDQILIWLDTVVDSDIVIERDVQPILKPAPASASPEIEAQLQDLKAQLVIKTQQHHELTAACQKRLPPEEQYDSKRRKEFMQITYREKLALEQKIRELQEQLRDRKKLSRDWGSDINHWTVEVGPKRRITVEHRLRELPGFLSGWWEYDNDEDYDQENESERGPRRFVPYDFYHRYTEFVELRAPLGTEKIFVPIPGGAVRISGKDSEDCVILCAYFLGWYNPLPEIVRKYPALRGITRMDGVDRDPGRQLDREGREYEEDRSAEAQSILKDGGGRLTIHGDKWEKLKSFRTFEHFGNGPDAEGEGFYSGSDQSWED